MIKGLVIGGEDGRHVLTTNNSKKKASFSSRQLNQHDIDTENTGPWKDFQI
jgi:hypothetical protein